MPEEQRHEIDERNQKQKLSGERQEDGFVDHSQTLEKVRCDHLETYQGKCQVYDSQSLVCQFFQLCIIREERYRYIRNELGYKETDSAYYCSTNNRKTEYPLDSGVFPCTEIITCDRLHSQVESHVYHDEQE